MDGTGRLFADFYAALEARGYFPRAVAYPAEEELGYRELIETIRLPSQPFVVVAESFSGPLGIMLAARHPEQVRALVLAASFARDPTRLAARLGARLGPWLFDRPPPRWGLRWGLYGADAPAEVVAAVETTIPVVSASVLAFRLREIVKVDVRAELTATRVPVMYLGGRRDRLVRPRVARELKRARPDLEVCWLDAPHLLLQRRPTEASAHVGALIARVTA